MDQFNHKKISKPKGLKVLRLIELLKKKWERKSGFRPVWSWYMTIPEIVVIIRYMGFDCIVGNEGAGVETVGVFDSRNLTKL
jgi:hypothetical protein